MSLSKNVCVRVLVHVRVCARACVCVCMRARAPLCVCLGLSCESACFWFCLCARARESVCESACVRACCTYVCVCSTCVCLCLGATALCGHTRGTAGTGGAYSSACDVRTARRAARCVGHRSVRSCARRRDVDEPYDQRAVGCAIWTHVRGRRRRRHLRHRRLRRHHPLPGRVGEHRRRCGPDSRGVVGG